jgi:hypothetical protein
MMMGPSQEVREMGWQQATGWGLAYNGRNAKPPNCPTPVLWSGKTGYESEHSHAKALREHVGIKQAGRVRFCLRVLN